MGKRTTKLSKNKALDLLRRPGHVLMLMHTRDGDAWHVVPGGPIGEADAVSIIARSDMHARDNPLFPGLRAQSWQLGSDST